MPSLEEAMRQSEDGIEQLDDGLITPINDVFMINPETRIIEVPESERLFGVNFDKDVEKKYFKCPKIVGNNIDLSKHKIYVVYQKANENITTLMGEVGKYWCEDAKVDETGDYIEFSWLLSGNVLEEQGFIAFKVVAVYTDTETGELKTRWNTVPSVGLVRFTLSDGEEITEQYADVITQLLLRMDAVEDIATPEAMQGYVEQYLNKHPIGLDETLTDNKKAAPANLVGQLKEDLGEQQTEYNGMIKFQQGVIDGNEVKYNETRIAVTELPQKWVSVTASDGYDIRAAVYNASGALLGYNLSENIWGERTIFKSTLKQLYPDFSYSWLQIRKNDNSSMTLNDATKSISFILFQLEKKNYINALEYGFYNYGNISNDVVMRKYLENDSEKELYFPNGTYLFTKKIEVTNGCKIRMDSEAELKLSADVGNIGGHFFIFGDKSKTKIGCYIIGGIINANFGTASAVCLDSIQSARIENCILKNANQYGIQTGRTQNLRASNFYMHGCRIVNEKYVQGAIGIYDNAYDNSFDNVIIVDFPIGIETASSKFNRVHMWLSSATFIPNSIGIILDNNPSCFINCTIDTYQRGVVSRGTKHYEFNSSNLTFFLNTDVYTKEIAVTNPPVLFHQVIMSESFTSLPILHCHGITINETGYDVKLADFEYSEDLLKKIWCSGVTQNDNIKNDSFTVEKRLFAT